MELIDQVKISGMANYPMFLLYYIISSTCVIGIGFHSFNTRQSPIDKTIEIPVQINGKTKAVLSIAADEAKDVVLAKAKELLGAKITGTIVKEIYVKGRIYNIVAK